MSKNFWCLQVLGFGFAGLREKYEKKIAHKFNFSFF